MTYRGRGRGRGRRHHPNRQNDNGGDNFIKTLTVVVSNSQAQQSAQAQIHIGAGDEDSKQFFTHPRVMKALKCVRPLDSLTASRAGSKMVVAELARMVNHSISPSAAPNTVVQIRIGRLVGTTTRQNISLPVLSEVLLCPPKANSTTSSFEFDSGLSEGELASLTSHTWKCLSERLAERSLRLRGGAEEQFVDEEYADRIHVHKRPGTGEVLEAQQAAVLETQFFYRPGEEIHLSFVSSVRKDLKTADLQTIGVPVRVLRKRRQRFNIVEGPEESAIGWVLTLTSTLRPEGIEDDERDGTAELEFSDHFRNKLVSLAGAISATTEDKRESSVTKGPIEAVVKLPVWGQIPGEEDENEPLVEDQRSPNTTSLPKVESKLDDSFWRGQAARLLKEYNECLHVVSGLFLNNARILASYDTEAGLRRAPETQRKSRWYYPNLFGDIVAETRLHYNLKKIGVAAESAIEIVRKSNNQAKRLLVDEYVATGSRVLDLACGHGQDLLKYTKKELKLFVGIDVSTAEIREARARFARRSPSIMPAQCRFHVGNMLQPETYANFLKGEAAAMDVVSVQLAIHYTLQTEENANLILENIAKRLKPGGMFIGSCPSSFVIHRRMREALVRDTSASTIRYLFGNEVYNVIFSTDTMNEIRGYSEMDSTNTPYFADSSDKRSLDILATHPWLETYKRDVPSVLSDSVLPLGFSERDLEIHNQIDDDPLLLQLSERWGLVYNFWLVDHIDASEYVVPWRAFCRMARDHGLRCLLACPFDEYIQRLLQRGSMDAREFDRRIQQIISTSSTAMQQAEVIAFYQVFAFEKMLTGREDPHQAMSSLALRPPALSIVGRAQGSSALSQNTPHQYAAMGASITSQKAPATEEYLGDFSPWPTDVSMSLTDDCGALNTGVDIVSQLGGRFIPE